MTWDPKVETQKRKQVGTLGGVTFYTEVYLDGEKRGEIMHPDKTIPKPPYKSKIWGKYMAVTKHRPYKGKYYAKLQTAIRNIVKEEKKYVPIEKAFAYM